MKALKSNLACRVLQQAFYDRDLSSKIIGRKPFVFEGKLYKTVIVPREHSSTRKI